MSGPSPVVDLRMGASNASEYCWIQSVRTGVGNDRSLVLNGGGGGVVIGSATATALGELHVDQDGTGQAIPVLYLDQADISEEFIHFVGESATDASQSLSSETGAGSVVGWIQVYIEDVKSTGAIADGKYWIPFYSDPTA